MMVRPYDQAKLLFLCFLRSSSSFTTLATSSPKPLPSSSSSSLYSSSSSSSSATDPTTHTPTSPLPPLDGHISLRVATRHDVPSIGRCNLATLPENYSHQFYNNHMSRWPDLALVAEHFPATPPPSSSSTNNNNLPYDPPRPPGRIVGYVLGKIEPSPSPPTPTLSHLPTRPLLRRGHVTSLAVLTPYRRRNLATLLMNQLHYHMAMGHDATEVGLHVRVSNRAAKRLYGEGMGYQVQDVISGYYQDGEDALFLLKGLEGLVDEMKRKERMEGSLPEEGEEVVVGENGRWKTAVGGVVRSWRETVGRGRGMMGDDGPLEMRLPRIVPLGMEEEKRARLSSRVVDVDGTVDGNTNTNGMVDGDGERNGMSPTNPGGVLEGLEGGDVGQRVMTGSL